MNKKIIRRIMAFLLIFVMTTGISDSASAKQTASSAESKEEVSAEARAIGSGDSEYISSNGSITLYPTLTTSRAKMYFWFWGTSLGDNTPSGKITYRVYEPDGDYLFKRTVSVDTYQIDVYPFPETGTYKVVISSGVSEKLFVNATWSLQGTI